MKLEWREYPYDSDIMVSNTGRVLSYKSGKCHELTPSDNGRGYLTVSLGIRNPKYIHPKRECKDIKKPVKVVETGKVYDSITECAKDIRGTVSGIVDCKKGRQRAHRGYHFDFLEDGDADV